MKSRLEWSVAATDPPLVFRGHIASAGSLMIDIVDGWGAGLAQWDGKDFVVTERFGRQVASTRSFLRKGGIPPHELRRIHNLVATTPTAVRAKAYIDGMWVVL